MNLNQRLIKEQLNQIIAEVQGLQLHQEACRLLLSHTKMQITQILHTAILVSDLELSEHFYGTILGLAKIDRTLKYPGVWYQIGNYQIHLIVSSSVPTENQNEKWGRNPHIAFSVVDLEAAKTELQNQNYPFQASASGRPAIFTKDPDGNIIELSQQ